MYLSITATLNLLNIWLAKVGSFQELFKSGYDCVKRHLYCFASFYFLSLLVCRTREIFLNRLFLTSHCHFCYHILNLHQFHFLYIYFFLIIIIIFKEIFCLCYCCSCFTSLTLSAGFPPLPPPCSEEKLPELYKKLGQKVSLEASSLKLCSKQPDFKARSSCSEPYPVRLEDLQSTALSGPVLHHSPWDELFPYDHLKFSTLHLVTVLSCLFAGHLCLSRFSL